MIKPIKEFLGLSYTHKMKTQNKTNETLSNAEESFYKFIKVLSNKGLENLKQDITAQQLLNQTESEPFTIEERTDLNIKKVVGK